MTGKILVIRGGAIGDFVLTLPALAALRKKFPHHRLEVLGYPKIAKLALDAGIVDGLRSVEDSGLVPFFVRDSELPTAWQDYFASFDLIVSFLHDPETIFQTNIKRCGQAQFVAGSHRPVETESVHATQFFLSPLKQIGIFDANPLPCLEFAESRSVSKTNEVWIAAHPGSGSPKKNWAEENWIELLQMTFDRTDWSCLLIGGEAEGDRLQRFQKKLCSTRLQLAQDISLMELAQKLKSCNAFVGHDSGITHLAAAVGVPVVVLWGQTNDLIWRPAGDGVTLLNGGEKLLQIRPERVFGELEGLLRQ